ncbi:MAG: twin-arginine translocase subunit TatC [Chloroflexi bacterium]|nr:twin-arginine translocase subunit TatC [Chloroflexota bacterium]
MAIEQALDSNSPSAAAEEAVGRKLSLREHLLELRKRLVYSAIAVAVTTGATFVFTNRIMAFLERPLGGVKLVYLELTTPLVVWFNVALTVGIAAATPFVLLQVVRFVAPALYPREKVFLYSMLPAVLFAFTLGAAFAYFVLIPPAFKFLLTFGGEIATPLLTIDKYISLVTRLVFWIGIVFELPIAVFILARIGIVSARMLWRMWRWAVLGAFVAAAVITPTPDPVDQLIVAVPLIVLYGISILLAHFAQAGRKKRQAAP